MPFVWRQGQQADPRHPRLILGVHFDFHAEVSDKNIGQNTTPEMSRRHPTTDFNRPIPKATRVFRVIRPEWAITAAVLSEIRCEYGAM